MNEKNFQLIDDKMEDEVLNEYTKKEFFDIMKGIDFDEVVQKKKSCNEDFHKFNMLIRNIRSEKFSIINCAIYLYEDLFNIKEVLDCFDESNKYELRVELSKTYNIKINKSTLTNFLHKVKK